MECVLVVHWQQEESSDRSAFVQIKKPVVLW